MKSLKRSLEGLPWILKIILVILWDIYGNLARLVKSAAKGNVVGVVLAIILLFLAGFGILWIVDLIFVIIGNDIWWID